MEPFLKNNKNPSPQCDYGCEKRTATHIVDECPKRLLRENMKELHRVTIDSVQRIRSLDIYIWRPTESMDTFFLYNVPCTSKHIIILSSNIHK